MERENSREESEEYSTADGGQLQLFRNQVRQQLIEELLEACGKDNHKRQIVTKLAEKVHPKENEIILLDVDEDDGSEDENKYKWMDVESIDDIEDSPYEVGGSAEVGEELFEDIKTLLEPEELSTKRRRSGTGMLQPKKDAIKLLGQEQAEAMVTANFHIAESGMVFSPSWIDGDIRNLHIRGLTKAMVLLCLQEQRIARAEKGVMNKLVDCLCLADMIREALDKSEVINKDHFPRLSNCKATPLPYNRSKKYECQKCELFVARTFACMDFLKRKKLENYTLVKMLACLRIMEVNLEDASGNGTLVVRNVTIKSEPTSTSLIPASINTPRNEEKPPHGIEAVEQLDMKTGRVLAVFPSLRVAYQKLGKQERSSAINHNVYGNTKSAFGYFWRRVGSSDLPDGVNAADLAPLPSQLDKQQAIEMLDATTGKVLRTFPSIRDANVALKKKSDSSCIKDHLRGRNKTAYGFFWRKVGSSNLPIQPKQDDKVKLSKKQERQAHLPTNKNLESNRVAPSLQPLQQNLQQPLQQTFQQFQQTFQQQSQYPPNWVNNNVAFGNMGLHAGQVSWGFPALQGANFNLQQMPNNTNTNFQEMTNSSSTTENIWGQLMSSANFFWRTAAPLTSAETLEPQTGGVLSLKDDSQPRPGATKKRPSTNLSSTIGESRKKARQLRYDGSPDEPDVAPPRELAASPNQGHLSMREISVMEYITDSPYLVDSTAEVGEQIFDTFKELLVPVTGRGRGQKGPSELAMEIFGEQLAGVVLEASSKIGLSGMVYSTEWKDGVIRGMKIGSIPSHILLLLLQEQRFSRPGVTGALAKVVVDFELCRTIIKALVRWQMVNKFPKVSQVTTHSLFNFQKVQCYKCIIFIARVFNCMKILNVVVMPESIKWKVETCFQILEASLDHIAPKQSIFQGDTGKETIPLASAYNDDSSDSMIAAYATTPPREINESSHILFQAKPSAITKEAMMAKSHQSSNPSQLVLHQDQGPWAPYDSKEVILSPIETEIAWLVEESIYSLRSRDIQWRFVWKYASPTLRIELRKISDSSGDELEQLVRLQDSIVATRFANLRREIRRKLHRAQYRPRMEKAIPEERMASRQAMDKTLAVASSQAADGRSFVVENASEL